MSAFLAAALCLSLAAPVTAPLQHRHHVVGVLAHRPRVDVERRWQPVLDAIARAIPCCTFTLEVLDYEELDAAIRQDRLDLVVTSPAHYVHVRARTLAGGVLATLVERGPRGPLDAYGGAIFTRSDHAGLRALAELRGARIAATSLDSLGGYQAQAHELHRAGIPLPRGDRLLLTGMPHDRVVEAVLAGRADAGFVRSGTLEGMAEAGGLALDRIRIVNRQDLPDFPYAVSTRLYPDWPVVALPHLDEDHARRIAAALLALEGPLGPAEVDGVFGFAVAADYAPVEAMLRDLRLPPYEGAPAFRAGDVLRRYLVLVAGVAVVLAVAAGLTVWIAAVNRRLERARRGALEAAESRARALDELREAMASVRTLRGLLPICMYCHKIRTDQVSWDRLEKYLSEHSEAQFTHSICPSCYAAQVARGEEPGAEVAAPGRGRPEG